MSVLGWLYLRLSFCYNIQGTSDRWICTNFFWRKESIIVTDQYIIIYEQNFLLFLTCSILKSSITSGVLFKNHKIRSLWAEGSSGGLIQELNWSSGIVPLKESLYLLYAASFSAVPSSALSLLVFKSFLISVVAEMSPIKLRSTCWTVGFLKVVGVDSVVVVLLKNEPIRKVSVGTLYLHSKIIYRKTRNDRSSGVPT